MRERYGRDKRANECVSHSSTVIESLKSNHASLYGICRRTTCDPPPSPQVHIMQDKAFIVITIIGLFLVLFAVFACTILAATLNGPPKLSILPTLTAQQHEAGDASDGCNPTDVNPPMYTQDEGGNTLALPPPAVTRDERGNTTLVLPPAVTQNKCGYNSGRPHFQSSTFLPVHMDSSDG